MPGPASHVHYVFCCGTGSATGSLATRLAAPVAPHVSATATCRWARPAAVSGLHIARAAAARGFASMTGAPAAPHASESFLSGTNSVYVEEMYRLWKQDPSRCGGV